MSLVAYPTLLEQVGATLIAAGYPQASYQPPQLTRVSTISLGEYTPGWLIAPVVLPGGWIRLYYRPDGVLDATTRAIVQRAQLRNAYAPALEAAGWDTCMDRREGIPALLVRRSQP